MSGSDDDLLLGPEERRELLAAELVLGTLEREAAVAVAGDTSLAPRVLAWEQRLAPLQALAVPVAPPAILWPRIAFSLGLDTPAADVARLPAPRQPERPRLRFWQAATAGASGLAAALAVAFVIAFPRPIPPPRLATTLATPSGEASFVALVGRNHHLYLWPVRPIHLAAAHDMQLWVRPQGAASARSLGVLPVAGRDIARPDLPEGPAQLMVSLEPPGGSTTGAPTGPVLFSGAVGR